MCEDIFINLMQYVDGSGNLKCNIAITDMLVNKFCQTDMEYALLSLTIGSPYSYHLPVSAVKMTGQCSMLALSPCSLLSHTLAVICE